MPGPLKRMRNLLDSIRSKRPENRDLPSVSVEEGKSIFRSITAGSGLLVIILGVLEKIQWLTLSPWFVVGTGIAIIALRIITRFPIRLRK